MKKNDISLSPIVSAAKTTKHFHKPTSNPAMPTGLTSGYLSILHLEVSRVAVAFLFANALRIVTVLLFVRDVMMRLVSYDL
jgi:hypothetical protein